MTPRYNVAIIGAGTFTEQCHIPCLQADGRGRVVALVARTPEKVAAQAPSSTSPGW